MSSRSGIPLVIAHRGYAAVAPENTLAAFRLGWESGADGVECDVHLTADGQVVCIHDDDTKRVSEKNRVVATTAWDDLRGLDVGGWKGKKWAGEPIPLLEEAMQVSPSSLIWVVEIKCGPEIVEPLLDAIDAGGHDWRRVIVISFIQESLAELKVQRPTVAAYWLSYLDEQPDGSFRPSIGEIIGTVKSLQLEGFGGQSGRGVSAELVSALRDGGMELNVWTVDEPKEARRMRDIGVKSVTTNDPGLILEDL